jgi:hypothetical protein
LGLRSLKGKGDIVWENHLDTPMCAYTNLIKSCTLPEREDMITTRAREASIEVKKHAKHYRNLDRMRRMKIMALQQDIYEGKFVSWGFGKEFDEYFGTVDRLDRPDGRGMKVYSDGSVYIGEWMNGMRHCLEGKAVWTRPDGTQYEGTWMKDMKHGTGKLQYPDGSLYQGEFAQGYEHGHGVKTYTNGERFEGRFRFGKRDGPGTLHKGNGQQEKGIFKDPEAFHEAPLFLVVEDEMQTGTGLIFNPDSLLMLSVKAVAKLMQTNRGAFPNTRVHDSLQHFLKPYLAREFLSTLTPKGSKEFIDLAPKFAFQQVEEISLKYVKFLHHDMNSFLYFTTMNHRLTKLELVNNRLDPSSIDMINKQIVHKIWPDLKELNLSFNKIDGIGITHLMEALAEGTGKIEILKLSGCNITSVGAQAIGK